MLLVQVPDIDPNNPAQAKEPDVHIEAVPVHAPQVGHGPRDGLLQPRAVRGTEAVSTPSAQWAFQDAVHTGTGRPRHLTVGRPHCRAVFESG